MDTKGKTMSSGATPEYIYEKFVELEDRAASVYLQLAAHFPENEKLSAFWLEMAMQEKQHAALLQFCTDEQLFAENLPDDEAMRQIESGFREIEKRVARPRLEIDEAFEIALQLESSEANDIYSRLTVPTHNSLYLWRRKVASLTPAHVGLLATAARRFGAGEDVLRRLGVLCEKLS
jgi:rubrerythrin